MAVRLCLMQTSHSQPLETREGIVVQLDGLSSSKPACPVQRRKDGGSQEEAPTWMIEARRFIGSQVTALAWYAGGFTRGVGGQEKKEEPVLCILWNAIVGTGLLFCLNYDGGWVSEAALGRSKKGWER